MALDEISVDVMRARRMLENPGFLEENQSSSPKNLQLEIRICLFAGLIWGLAHFWEEGRRAVTKELHVKSRFYYYNSFPKPACVYTHNLYRRR